MTSFMFYQVFLITFKRNALTYPITHYQNFYFHIGIGNFGDRYFGTEFKIHGVPHYTCPDEN